MTTLLQTFRNTLLASSLTMSGCGKKEEAAIDTAAAAAMKDPRSIHALAAALAGLIMIAGAAWQIALWLKWLDFDSNDKEKSDTSLIALAVGLVLPVAISIVLALGIVVIGTVALSDEQNKSFTLGVFLSYVFKAVVLVLATGVKAAAGILIAAYVLSAEVYFYFTYGSFRPVPVIGALLDWVFSFGPNWLGTVWLGAQVSWSVATGTLYTVFSAKA